MARLTILDASVLLAHLDGSDPHAADARRILAHAERLAASTLTLAEVMVGSVRAGRLEEELAALRRLEIDEVPLERGAATALALLRAETGLRMPDCCVLHAADVTGADAIATRDQRLASAAARRGLSTP